MLSVRFGYVYVCVVGVTEMVLSVLFVTLPPPVDVYSVVAPV